MRCRSRLVPGSARVCRLQPIVSPRCRACATPQFRRIANAALILNRLAILPDVTHYETFMSPAMAAAVLPFINGESNAQSWADQVDANT